jgi:hypothetical protein
VKKLFEGSSNNDIILLGSWDLKRDEEVLKKMRFSIECTSNSSGYTIKGKY